MIDLSIADLLRQRGLQVNHITLENFRCFGERQNARLAPLTLLVGENSTGKTSFQAMIRPLLVVALGRGEPNFQEAPYDLGNFDDIAHHRGSRGGRAERFTLGFRQIVKEQLECGSTVTFARDGAIPVPIIRRHFIGDVWAEEDFQNTDLLRIRVGIEGREWEEIQEDPWLTALRLGTLAAFSWGNMKANSKLRPLPGSPPFTEEDKDRLRRELFGYIHHLTRSAKRTLPFAGAPTRSNPHRTYHPSSTIVDPGGDYIPMYLADMVFRDKKEWTKMKEGLEAFGKSAGLFDEIFIRPLTKRSSGPFQLEFRKFAGRRKGPKRNVMDMGYGVSQVLPVITELLRGDSSATIFLLQQPEVHLHPSAQAALGTLFCQIASSGRQLIVETHSDYILNRVRMDVRDGAVSLRPEDVSILFFERSGLDARIHSLELDHDGNVLNAPKGYRSFFMKEVKRSLIRGQR